MQKLAHIAMAFLLEVRRRGYPHCSNVCAWQAVQLSSNTLCDSASSSSYTAGLERKIERMEMQLQVPDPHTLANKT
jgi:hypothetical protein